jgi:hypothetical protein
MAQFTDMLISSEFAIGATHYEDFYPQEWHTARIVLTVTLANRVTTQAIVDTGAPWCIFAPDMVQDNTQIAYAPGVTLSVRGISYPGKLVRMKIGLMAELGGDDLNVEATVFIPTLPPGVAWSHPNFIGLDGFLNRVRFAVDPSDNVFYFAPV